MREMYAELGGADGVRTAVAVLYRRVTTDPELAHWFEGVNLERLQAHQRAFLAAAFGGPSAFGGRDLVTAHAEMGITDAAFERIVTTLLTALADLGVARPAISTVAERLEGLRSSIVTA